MEGFGQSIYEGRRALELFTDRHELIRLFLEWVNDDPPPGRILFLQGDGGTGKSLLLRYLHDRYCHRFTPETWQRLRVRPDEVLVRKALRTENAEPIPKAMIDFGMPSSGDERPREPFYALAMLRRDLSGHGLSFPLYDFACVWYLYSTRQLSGDRLRGLFPVEEGNLFAEVLTAMGESSWAIMIKAALNVFAAGLLDRLTVWLHRRGIDRERAREIQRMDPRSELSARLPGLFGEDLTRAMAPPVAPPRIALFFDTHDAFRGERRDLSRGGLAAQDEWLRLLLHFLAGSPRILPVVAGRDLPLWSEVGRMPIPRDQIHIRQVDNLAERDAALYLERCGIDPVLRPALIACGRVAPDEIHPLYLGMCADVALLASGRGAPLRPEQFEDAPEMENRERELVDRLFRHVDRDCERAIRALSACRAFDWQIYRELAGALSFHDTVAAFQTLTGFSFIWVDHRQGKGWHRVHHLLRRLLRDDDREGVVARADDALESYHRRRVVAGDGLAIVGALYHAARIDGDRAAWEWLQRFDAALERSDYSLCGALHDLRVEMAVGDPTVHGVMCVSAGNYLATLARHEAARSEYEAAIAAFDEALRRAPEDEAARTNRGSAFAKLGDLQARLSQHDQALESYRQAVAAFDEALRRAPGFVDAHNNRGNAFASLGDLQAGLSQHGEALESYRQAVTAFDEALRRASDYVNAHNNRGNALQSLGDLQERLSRHGEALESYGQAMAAYDEALRRAPEDVATHNNRASTLQRLGHLRATLSRHEEALESYGQAVVAYGEALRQAPEDVQIHNNRGIALQSLGHLEVGLAKHGEAMESYRQAVADYDEALRRAPDDVYAHSNRGSALRSLGEVQATLSRHGDAPENCRQAVVAFDEALRRAPEDVQIHNNQGNALQSLGDLQAGLSQHDQALDSYRQAVAAYDEVLRRAPDYVGAHNNRGSVLAGLGELLAALYRYGEALESYRQAIAAFDEALGRAPDYVNSHNNRGGALQSPGKLQAALSRHGEALESYRQAIAAYDEALQRAPDHVNAHNNRGSALARLGGLQAALSRHEEALESYQQAVAAHDEALRQAPGHVAAHNNRANVLQRLGDLQMRLARHGEALESHRQAVAAYDEALQQAPEFVLIHNNRGRALVQLARAQVTTSQPRAASNSLRAALAAFERSLEVAPADENSGRWVEHVRRMLDEIEPPPSP